jgi:hypothetical protein
MNISIFLSYPKPCFDMQQQFVAQVTDYLLQRGLAPRTLGITDYDMDAPLKAIRRLMLESNGLITIAFRRTFVAKGTARLDQWEVADNSMGAHRTSYGLPSGLANPYFPRERRRGRWNS